MIMGLETTALTDVVDPVERCTKAVVVSVDGAVVALGATAA